MRASRRSTRRASAPRPTSRCRPARSISTEDEWTETLADRTVLALSPFERPDRRSAVISFGGRRGRNFAAERAEAQGNVYEAVREPRRSLRKAGKRVVIAALDGRFARTARSASSRTMSWRRCAAAESWAEVRKRDASDIVEH